MAIPGPLSSEDVALASDSLQAAYFRGVLADRRSLLAAEIGRQSRRLSFLTAKTDSLAITRLRREIRRNEAEHRSLDRMIEALDRRFAKHWTDRH
jgi:hypothetical protein